MDRVCVLLQELPVMRDEVEEAGTAATPQFGCSRVSGLIRNHASCVLPLGLG